MVPRFPRDELERERLVLAGKQRAVAAAAVEQPELARPARAGLVEVGHAETDMVDAREPDHASRSASTSGTASATWIESAVTSGCAPGPARSTSQSTTVLASRPSPSISTSTRSPGSIGPEF